MTPDRWRRIREVFHEAVDLSDEGRGSYLATACAEDDDLRQHVQRLLAISEEAEDFIEEPAIGGDPGAAALCGRRVGPYELDELIGEGGMGAVYLAHRADDHFHQRVAIKIVKRGMDTDFILKRFRNERQILARLDHPNVARLLDGGVTSDGLPYFVMEYLEGIPIHEYCEARRPAIEQRLELFLPVCGAVHYAHQNLIVHRDIKASNILVVSDGTPKLLDFGIAKLLDRDGESGDPLTNPTAPGLRLMTPDYASPEQVRGATITTASDIYSLGVLLYEILTGQRPLLLSGRPHEDIVRIVTQEEPPKPSTLRRGLPPELDNIVAKAMSKDPHRRYASAEQLADDIRRHLEGRPILAREATWRYRATKFVYRNRGVMAAAAIVLVALFGGGGLALWQSGVAAAERSAAQAHLYEVRDLANSFMYEIDGELISLPGSTKARDLLVKRVVQYLDAIAKESNDPSLRHELATAYEKLGDVQGGPRAANLGDTATALANYRKSVEMYESLAAGQPASRQFQRDLSRGYHKLSDVISVLGDYEKALSFDKRALDIRQKLYEADPRGRQSQHELALSFHDYASTLGLIGRWNEVLEYRQKAYEFLQALHQSDPENTATKRDFALAAKRLGRMLVHDKKWKQALPYYQEALRIEMTENKASPTEPLWRMAMSFTYSDIGAAHFGNGEYRQALEMHQNALQIREALARADTKDARTQSALGMSHYRVANTLLKLGRPTEAEIHMRQSLQIREGLAATDTASAGAKGELAESLAGFGDVELALGKKSDARPYYQRALSLYTDLRNRKHLDAAHAAEPDRIAKAIERL